MKKTKIAIIAHNCRYGGGLIGTLSLLREMFAVSGQDEFLLVCSKGYGYEDLPLPAGSKRYVYEGSHVPLRRIYFEKVTLPKILNDYQPDVIFGPGTTGVEGAAFPQVLFIRTAYLYHDSSRYPQATLQDRLRAWALRRQVKKTLPKAQRIFVQTPVVLKRFSEYWNYPAGQIRVIRFPAPEEIEPQPDCPVPSGLKDHEGAFKILMLTRYMAHRNPEILIPLCQQYGDVFRRQNIRFITTVGTRLPKMGQIFLNKIKKQKLDDIIINVGLLNRQQVIQYYTHCDVMWLHTLMETLCLPFLESMRMGIPILSPDFDFARYVCGEAALYYDPWDVQSIYEKIMMIKEDQDLRRQLVLKGERELKLSDKISPSWKQTAEDVLNNLKEIADK